MTEDLEEVIVKGKVTGIYFNDAPPNDHGNKYTVKLILETKDNPKLYVSFKGVKEKKFRVGNGVADGRKQWHQVSVGDVISTPCSINRTDRGTFYNSSASLAKLVSAATGTSNTLTTNSNHSSKSTTSDNAFSGIQAGHALNNACLLLANSKGYDINSISQEQLVNLATTVYHASQTMKSLIDNGFKPTAVSPQVTTQPKVVEHHEEAGFEDDELLQSSGNW